MQASTRSSSLWLWLAAAVAFSPALAALALPVLSTPRAITAPVAAALLISSAVRERGRGAAPPRPATLWLALAAALEVFGIFGGVAVATRVSVPMAIAAMALRTGAPTLPAALLSLWLVPIPISLLEPVRAPVEHAVGAYVAAVAALGSPEAIAAGPMVRVRATTLELDVRDAGLHLAHLLALLGWYGASRRGEGIARAAWSAAKTASGALLLQPIFLALAAFALVLGSAGWARALLSPILPGIVVAIGVLRSERPLLRPR